MKIKKWQIWILKWITKSIVEHGPNHENNIITYYAILFNAAKNEFTEDNLPTIRGFLIDCLNYSFKKKVVEK